MKLFFQLPDEVTLNGVIVTQAQLREALTKENYQILRPLIDEIVSARGDEREKLFNFFLGGIQFGVEHCVRKLYGYFDRDIQEEIFWQGIAHVWENLAEFDETKSNLLSWVWEQVKYGSRNARRKEQTAKKLLARCQNNPALVAEEYYFEAKRSEKGLGVAVTTLSGAIGRELNELSIQERNALRESMNALREKDRMLLSLKIVDQLSAEEIAARLGNEVSRDAVHTACSRALGKLRSLYTDKLIQERAKRL